MDVGGGGGGCGWGWMWGGYVQDVVGCVYDNDNDDGPFYTAALALYA